MEEEPSRANEIIISSKYDENIETSTFEENKCNCVYACSSTWFMQHSISVPHLAWPNHRHKHYKDK